jgi:hypothetical protein
MTTPAEVTTNLVPKLALTSDWVDTHADYLFNFKSSLLEPATRNGHALTAGVIAYQLTEGE